MPINKIDEFALLGVGVPDVRGRVSVPDGRRGRGGQVNKCKIDIILKVFQKSIHLCVR